jgi:predicted metal-binding transcription factor (methanogenesis marker protein 9)
MVDTKIFAVENGIATVPFEILNKVAYERDFKSSLPKSYPKEAGEIYHDIMDIANSKTGIKVVDKGVIVPEKFIRTVGRHEGVAPIGMHRLIGHIGTLYLQEKADKERSMSIAISCQEKGITVAFGQNVWACTNQCVFGEKVMQTFGKNSTPYDKMLEVLRQYMVRFDEIKQEEEDIIQEMNNIRIDHVEMLSLVGDLYIQSRKNNIEASHGGDIMNVSEMGKFIDTIITSPTEGEVDLMSSKFDMNLWDFYNHATKVLNPLHNNDPVNVLRPIGNLSKYLLNRFDITKPQLN